MRLAIPWLEVVGVSVGGCVTGERLGVRLLRDQFYSVSAHAHARDSDPFKGWICVRKCCLVGRVKDKVIVRPSHLLWHEYAHILTGHDHDNAWRRMMKQLEQPIPHQYKRRREVRDEGS